MPYFGYRGWGGCKIVFLWENLFLNHRPSTVVHIQHCANFFWLPWNNRNGYLWKRASICGNITMWISDTVHRVIRSILAATPFVFWAFGGSEVAFCRWCGSVGFIRWWARACPGAVLQVWHHGPQLEKLGVPTASHGQITAPDVLGAWRGQWEIDRWIVAMAPVM